MVFIRTFIEIMLMQKNLNIIGGASESLLTSNSKEDEVKDSKTINKETLASSVKENFEDRAFFEIFGIKLYYDDILLISIIFFLYDEGIEDTELFIALILLLLT